MDDLQTEIIRTVLAIATPVLATLATALIVKALQKIGLSVDAEKQAKLEYLATQAILRAEEWAAARIKAQVGSTTAAMKLEKALTDLTDRVPGISREEAAALVHATLPKLQLGATGFLQGVRSAATAEPAR
jgi:hypothetical protein